MPINRDSDYSYEIKFKQAEGTPNTYFSLIFGFYDWKNYASVSMTSSGYIKSEENYQGKEYKMVESFKVDSTKISGPGEWTILKFAQVGDESFIYLNGHKVATQSNFDFYGHVLGFAAGSNQKLIIDYIKVKRKSQ